MQLLRAVEEERDLSSPVEYRPSILFGLGLPAGLLFQML